MTEHPRVELADRRASVPVRLALRTVFHGGVLVAAALLAIVIGVAIHLEHKRLAYPRHAVARVVGHQIMGVRAYRLAVEYADAAGSAHASTIDMRGPLPDTIPIDYDADHPERARWHQPGDLVVVATLLGFGSFALTMLVIALAVGVRRLRRLQRGAIRS